MDKKMTSGEIAKKVGVSQKTIRLYDEKGLLKPSEYSEGNYRLYDKEALLILENIIALKQIGFSLEEIRDTLINADEMNIVDSLNEQLRIMEEKKREIERVIGCIKGMLARTEGNPDWNTVAEIAKTIQKDQEADENHLYSLKHTAENKDWYETLFEYVNVKIDSKVLDIGCGFAKIWRNNWDRIPSGVQIDAVDMHGSWADNFSEFINDNAHKLADKTKISMYWGDVEEEDTWKDFGIYQHIVAHYLLDFINDKESFMKKVAEHLASDGVFSCNYVGSNKEHYYWMKKLNEIGVDTKFIYDIIQKNIKKSKEFEELLGKYFDEVECVRFSNAMKYDDCEEVYDKLCKSYPISAKILETNKVKIMEMLSEEIEENGQIVVENESEFLSCRK